jgi:hypothetical protein
MIARRALVGIDAASFARFSQSMRGLWLAALLLAGLALAVHGRQLPAEEMIDNLEIGEIDKWSWLFFADRQFVQTATSSTTRPLMTALLPSRSAPPAASP